LREAATAFAAIAQQAAEPAWKPALAKALTEDALRGGASADTPDSVIALCKAWLNGWGRFVDATVDADALLGEANTTTLPDNNRRD